LGKKCPPQLQTLLAQRRKPFFEETQVNKLPKSFLKKKIGKPVKTTHASNPSKGRINKFPQKESFLQPPKFQSNPKPFL